MATNLIAITQAEPVYPGFVSVNREDDGAVTIVVRRAPEHYVSKRHCGKSCFPGQAGCNNWCGYKPDDEQPDKPEGIDIVEPGATVSLTISGAEWDAAVAGLVAG